MKISHKFINVDGSEGKRSSIEDFKTVGNRFLKRIIDIVGDNNEKLLDEINDFLNKYNQGNYEEADSCLSQIIKSNPTVAEELKPFQEICSRVLSCEKNHDDLLYEKYKSDLKEWRSKSIAYRLFHRKEKPIDMSKYFFFLPIEGQVEYKGPQTKIRCKYCGHYTPYIIPDGGFAYFGNNNCQICGRGYPAPTVKWDNIDGQAYIYYQGSVTEDEFYKEFEKNYEVSPRRDYFKKK